MKPSPSMRAAWRSCPRKVFFRWVAGLEQTRPSQALTLGKAFHAGVEELRRTGDLRRAIETAKAGVEDPVAKAQVGAYVYGYAAAFPDDEVVAVEASVFGEDAAEKGYLDAIIRDGEGNLWLVEDKTTSQWLDPETTRLALKQSDQLATYLSEIRRNGTPVAGCLYRQVKKTACRVRKDETIANYEERLRGEYVGGDLIREIPVAFSDAELCFARINRVATNMAIERQVRESAEFKHWPWNEASCVSKFGACEYVHLCATGEDRPDRDFKPGKESLDDGVYQRRIWNLGEGGNREASVGPSDAEIFGGPQ